MITVKKDAIKYKDSDGSMKSTGVLCNVGVDESIWVEDNSPVIYERQCYTNTNIALYITENGTATYKRRLRVGNNGYYAGQRPQWNYSNAIQVAGALGEFSNLIYKVEQAEITNLDDYTEDEQIKIVGQNTFSNMIAVKRIKLPNNIESIEMGAFSLCFQLKELNLPNTVKSIGNKAFYDCRSLKYFDIPPLVTVLGQETFKDCYNLKKVNGIERMTTIGTTCFDFCVSLEGTIVLNRDIVELGGYTFRACLSLEKIIFLGTPNTIANNVFPSCPKLKDIYVPWSEGEVANAPWGATNATIHYNTTYDENNNPIV